MEAFKKIPSSFGALVRKPGLGGKSPPHCNTRINQLETAQSAKTVYHETHSSNEWLNSAKKILLIHKIATICL